MRIKLLAIVISLMLLVGFVGCGTLPGSKIVYEKVDMAWISNVHAEYDDNPIAASEYNKQPIKIELTIDEITKYGFNTTYSWHSQHRNSWYATLPVVLKNPKVMADYNLKDKVTITGILVVGEKIYPGGINFLNYGVGIKDASIETGS